MKKEMLGSSIEIKLPDSSLFSLCFDEIARIENEYSRFLETSALSEINRKLGVWHAVSDEFIFLLEKALEISQRTAGNFDITLKTSLDNLGYDSSYSFLPKGGVMFRHPGPIVIDKPNKRVLVRKEIDFGGFGKGYAADRVAEILQKNGIDNLYINAGGDIRAEGSWTVLLEHPDDPEKAIGRLELRTGAIACSAPNRRKWGEYHHLLNARTGMPEKSVKCIFVVARTGLEADAYATGLFTAGFEKGIELSKTLPVEMLMVSSNNKMYRSPGFNAELFS